MDKGSCFCIEGNELYLEQVLVDHNDIPIFFVCKDTMAYYVVLCSDIEELSYIVIEPSTLDLYRLLHGMLSMREVFTKQKNYWEIISGETIESDVVLCKPIQEIDHSVLPEEGACFEILTDEVSSYVERFDAGFLLKERAFVKLYEGQLKQKIAAGLSNKDIEHEGSMYDIIRSSVAIVEEHPEKWQSTEMAILAYAS